MYRDEMPEQPAPEPAGETPEDCATLRRKQLDRLLSYKGKIDLDLDQETLKRLRSTP